MDISDERRKKLEAGKEKLAAFRKKKAKSKKPVKDNGDNLNPNDVVDPINGDVNNPSDEFASGLIQLENDQDSKPTILNETQPFHHPHQEDAAERKSVSPQPIRQTQRVITEENTNSNCKLEPEDFGDSDVSTDVEFSDLEKALAQRDKLIGQLTYSLKSNADQQTEKEELASQVLTLAQQVTQLQTQLKDADQTLQEQLQFHGISTSALQSAKTQMLQLQSIVHEKDKQLHLATQQLENNHESLQHSKEESDRLSQRLSEKDEEFRNLQQYYDAAVSSHVEKQEKEESEKSNQLFELQRQWMEREGEIKATLGNQAKEIEDWRKSEQQWKEKEFQLQQNYEHLFNQLQQESGKEERLKSLENELETLRQQNEFMIIETADLKIDNEQKDSNYKSCLSKLETLADEHSQLSLLHSNKVDELDLLKSKNTVLEESFRELNLENGSMRSQLEELSSKLAEEQEKLKSFNEYQSELELKHSVDCDKLNNKINELQSNLSLTQESLGALEKSLAEEKECLGVLQKELLNKESSLENTSEELLSFTSRNTELQFELQTKQDQIEELENLLEEKSNGEETFKSKEIDLNEEKMKIEENVDKLTKELDELKNECERNVEELSQLKNESFLAEQKVDTLNNELDMKNEMLADESDKREKLESDLSLIEEERNVLNETIKSLNDEISVLKDDNNNEKLQKDILGEELISVNSMLMESQTSVHNNTMKSKQSDNEHKALVEQYRSEIAKLQTDVENFKELDNKLLSSAQDFDKLNAQLKDTQESLKIKTEYCENVKDELENAKEEGRLSACWHKDVEDELMNLKQEHQEMVEREKESVQNQEEMQQQLESTVNQWQKLQLIVQEKEIELHNLHDDLDEQKRICSTMKKNHDEYLYTIQSDVDSLKQEKGNKEARVTELEGMMDSLQNSLAAKDVELSDTMTRVETVGVSSQNLAVHLSEKEKELDLIISDKDKVSTDLSDRLKDIEKLEAELSKAKNEASCLSEDLELAKAEISMVKSNLEVEKEEKESALKCLESKNHEFSDKEKDLASQLESLHAQMTEAQEFSTKIIADKSDRESLISELENKCCEKDEILSQHEIKRQELENLSNKEQQQLIRLHGELSSVSQDLQSKEDLLVANSCALDEKVAESTQKEEDLMRVTQEIESLQAELDKEKDKTKALERKLELTSEDKESFIEKLQQRDAELDQVSKERDELNSTFENLKVKLNETETNFDIQAAETNDLNLQISHLRTSCDEKDMFLSEEQEKVEKLRKELDGEIQLSLRLKGTISSFSEDLDEKGKSLVQQGVLAEERMAEVSRLETALDEKDCMMKEVENENTKLVSRNEELVSKETEVNDLKGQLDTHEHEMTELSIVNKELSENLNQLEQDVKKKEGDIVNLKQEVDILQKECGDLKEDLQEEEDKNLSLMSEVDSMKAAIHAGNEEKEILKNNFDACLEEMQQKLSAQEIEKSNLKSKLAEESWNRDQGQEEMKEMYMQQLAEMEDKLIVMDGEKSQAEKEIEEKNSRLDKMSDDCERQVSESELSLQAAQSELMKMKDEISKINTSHENELTDLKSLHELQMSELMDNYLSLEKSMTDVQRALNDQAENMKRERNETEQSFENLMSEMDERKRRSDSDIIRLKKQQEEMTKDHEKEMKALEKKYEIQLFDLEDRCSVMTAELERLRNSVVGVEGEFAGERKFLENKIDELENVRRELEIKCTILENDIALLKEQSSMSEDEAKSILKTAAEKQSEMKYEIENLEERLRVVKIDGESSGESMRKEFKSKIKDLSAENKHLKDRLKSLEVNAELDRAMSNRVEKKAKSEDLNSRLEEMKKQMTVVTDENLSLKRRLLGHKSLEKKVRLLSADVKDIRLPLEEPCNEEEVILPDQMRILTSTPSKRDYENHEPFSPTADEVSLIEGFVSETNNKPASALRFGKISLQHSADEEPDFVAEEDDQFQPETVIEKAVDYFDGANPNVHPIRDNVITEGFQLEVSDHFFAEISEESNTSWPLELSGGSSPTPTSKLAPQTGGWFDEQDGGEEKCQQADVELLASQMNSLPLEPVSSTSHGDEENQNEAEELEKRIKQMKEDLEEEYVFKLRQQRQDIILELEAKNENIEKELEHRFTQKEQSIKHEWELKFAKAVKKMKKDFEKKLQKQQSQQSSNLMHHSGAKKSSKNQEEETNEEEEDELPATEEGNEGLGNVVEQLSKENQELAEVRDELLKQIEISQARGRHDRVQNQLQSVLSEREKESVPSSQDISMSSEKDVVIEPELVQVETVSQCAAASPGSPITVDVHSTNSNRAMTTPERSPTEEAERFLEELEDIEQQSSQDLPLEWELTNTVPVDQGAVSENEAEHQSVWEVFGSRCVRQDCQEVRNRYRRLCQCVVTSFGIGEDLVSDESGLVQQNNLGEEEGEGGGKVDNGSNVDKGVVSLDSNSNNPDEDEVDELFADNVTLESELLSLAENMVLYKEAFLNKKSELEKENEFLTLELETESMSRKEEQEKFDCEKEEMKSRVGALENQLASFKTIGNETKVEFCDKKVMTDHMSQDDIDLLKSELEEQNNDNLKKKIETIQSLQQEMDYLKSQFEDESREHQENTDIKIKALEEEVMDLKAENNYLCLTHEGKEETIIRLRAENEHFICEKDNLNETLSEKESKFVDKEKYLQSSLVEREEQIENLNKKISSLNSKLEDVSKSLESKESRFNVIEKDALVLRDENKDLQSALNMKEEHITDVDKEVIRLKSEIEDVVKNSSLKESQLEKENNDLKDQNSQLKSDLVAKEEETEGLNTSVLNLTSQLEDSVKNSSGVIDTLEVKMSALEENSNSGMLKKEEMITKLDLEVNQLRSEKEVREKMAVDKENELKLLENELVAEGERCVSLQSICNKHIMLAKDLEFKADETNSQLQDLKLENDRLHTKAEEQQHTFSQEAAEDKNNLRILEEQLSCLKEDNRNLRSILEAKEESLSKSELEVDSLGSKLHELSSRLNDLQQDNDRLKTLEQEIGVLKDEHCNLLLADETEKQETIGQLNQEIDQLKSQLIDFEQNIELTGLETIPGETSTNTEKVVESEPSHPVEAEIVSESYCGNQSSNATVSKPNERRSSSQLDIINEDEIVPVQSHIVEQVMSKPSKETDSDVRSLTDSQSETEDNVFVDAIDPLTNSLYASTSSMGADQQSVVSSSNQSSGIVSPSELQDQALVEELNQLKKDLKETKAIYSRENSLLHKALEREKKVKDFVLNTNDVESNPAAGSSEGETENDDSTDNFNPATDMKQKLDLCLEQNKMLEEENGKLRTKIRKQEAVVLIYKHRLSEKEHDSELWRKSLTSQLQALQKQRDDLVQLLRNQETGMSSSCPSISEAIGQAALKEESLRRVQDDLMEKMEELDHLHQMLTQRQVELQHCDVERRHLEQLCLLKDQTEMQLMKQKRLMEEQVSEIEHRLKERESMLSEEKAKLLEELRDKDERLVQMSQPQSPRSPLASSSHNRSCSMGDLSSIGTASFGVDLNSSAEEADQHHLKAIETLREKLRLEYNVRTSRLAESQASAVASYWLRHQDKNNGSQNLDK